MDGIPILFPSNHFIMLHPLKKSNEKLPYLWKFWDIFFNVWSYFYYSTIRSRSGAPFWDVFSILVALSLGVVLRLSNITLR